AGRVLKLGRLSVVEGASGQPGAVVDVLRGQGPVVATGSGGVLIERLKPPGKGWMDAWAYQQGHPFRVGDRFEGIPASS
ncbi:MAG: methionyl-tRNA formyltransferase, partial [Candidatus Eremiobacterota bacterium]